ncbi:MAG: hypothetical protein R3C32_00250 [Chloroflexota bacterium]
MYSAFCAVLTILGSVVLIVPTAYWVRLKVPRLRPIVEFVTLLPPVVPPVVLCSASSPCTADGRARSPRPTRAARPLLVAAYVVLSLPYMYRSVDTGLRAIDIRTLTEAAQSLAPAGRPSSSGSSCPTCAWP